ncbi:MAG: hypothetical protein ACK2T7_08000 [Anaerolineales bacterium]
MKKNKFSFLLPLILLILTPLLMADMGPKPTAEFTIIYEVSPAPELVDYALYTCDSTDCIEPRLVEQLGLQHFDCTQDSCSSMAYGYGEYMYITLSFADGTTLTSNVFTKEHFEAEYEIVVGQNSLTVTETGGSNTGKYGGIAGLLIVIYALYACIGIIILAVIILVLVLIVRAIRKRAIRTD